MIGKGTPIEAMRRSWQADVERFLRLREPYLLY